jgi:hypothetical protein
MLSWKFMPPPDLGREAIVLLRGALGVGPGWTVDDAVHWTFGGALQCAWSEPVTPEGNKPAWRVHLRTRLADGFTGSYLQTLTLSSCMPHASLAGIVSGVGPRTTLKLASAVDVDDGSLGSKVQMLVAAARAQVADARNMASFGRKLTAAALTPLADLAAALPDGVLTPAETVLGEMMAGRGRSGWAARAVSVWIAALRPHSDAKVVRTPWGLSATLSLGWTDAARSVLEVRADAGRLRPGQGISIGLWTPVRGGPLDAIGWNEREVGPGGAGWAIGGWWAPEGGFLVHRCFWPAALCQPDLLVELLQAYTRRAEHANRLVAALE